MTRCTDSIYCTGRVPCEGCEAAPPMPVKPHLRVVDGAWRIVNWQEWNRSMQPDRFYRAFYWVRERNFKVML